MGLFIMKNSVCCIGDPDIKYTTDMWKKTDKIMGELIKKGTTRFLFGKCSDFSNLCFYIASVYKRTNPEISRIKIKLDESEKEYGIFGAMDDYDKTVILKLSENSEETKDFRRYRAMIYKSDTCIFYCDARSDGDAARAYRYAAQKNKRIINCFE